MKARDIMAGGIRGGDFFHDLVERHARRIHHARAFGAVLKQRLGHEGTRIEANRAGRDQIPPAQRDKVGRARPRTDEMYRHLSFPSLSAIAAVAIPSPEITRTATSRPPGPTAASAAASQSDPVPKRS